MPGDVWFIVYSLTYRLAVLLAGISCVYMGYRLFVLGVMPKDGSEIDASSGEIRLTVKNAAPGTCFAALGVMLVAMLLADGLPEKTKVTERDNRGNSKIETSLRGNGDVFPIANDGEIARLSKLLQNPSLKLGEASRPLSELAKLYFQQGRVLEARSLLRLSYGASPRNTETLHLLSMVEGAIGNCEDALKSIRLASELDPSMSARVTEMEQQYADC